MTMYIPDFNYHKPANLAEALSIMEQCDSGIPLAGGTDLLVEIKKGVRKVTDLVSLSSVDELKKIENNNDNIVIGPGLTHNQIADSEIIKSELPALSDACSKIGSHQIRNSGTIGGNLCTGASCADTAPILMAYDAEVKLQSNSSERILPLVEFMKNHHVTDIGRNEIMTEIIIKKSNYKTFASFEKFGLRDAASISVASSSCVLKFDGEICNYAKVVVGACSPVPVISENASMFLLGKNLNDLSKDQNTIDKAAELASGDSKPISDIRGTADYRRHLVKVLTVKALSNCFIQ